jgi:hypothetical protein
VLLAVPPDDQLSACVQFRVHEFIQGYGPVDDIGLGQASPFVDVLEIGCCLGDERYGDPVAMGRRADGESVTSIAEGLTYKTASGQERTVSRRALYNAFKAYDAERSETP